ncbi:hypothetical protein ACLB1T_18360 [Escherichia coli]
MRPWPRMPLVGTGSSAEHSGQAFTVILHYGTFCLRPQTAQLWLNQAKVTATSDLIQLRQGD